MYARWTAKGGYTVSYDTAGGIPASVSDKENVTWTTAGLLPKTAPTKAGHTFAGWNVTSGGSGKNVQSTATYGDVATDDSTKTITLTAQWTANPVTPTYALTVTNGAGGGGSSYAENATVTITADPAPEGQIFDSWESSNGGTFGDANSAATTFTMPAKAVTVTANYKDDPNPPVTNGWVYKDGAWKYFANGKAKIGWIYDRSKWYYTNKDGIMQTGWIHNQNKWYYLAGNGAMKTGWVKNKGSWYYFSGNGSMIANKWLKGADGSWYYLSGSGKMLTGKQKIGGKTYTFKSNGVWIG
jgi:uncharacterized repeat protein (TIGR02543 family)